jgi:hypothetical protein
MVTAFALLAQKKITAKQITTDFFIAYSPVKGLVKGNDRGNTLPTIPFFILT